MVYTVPLLGCRIFLWCLVLVARGRAHDVTVCPGAVLSIQDLTEYSKKKCTVIEGPFVLRGAPSDSDDTDNEFEPAANISITPLDTIVEITGFLLVRDLEKGVDNLGQILPNLAVVRGYPPLQFPEMYTSVKIADNKYLKSISLTKLTNVLGDDTIPALLWDNSDLEYIHTVKWDEISSKKRKASFYGHSGDMASCPQSCSGFCWNEHDCQKFLPVNCSAADLVGNCSCHEECLSSCNGETDRDCISCKHFYYQGQCVPSCPKGTSSVAGWRCAHQCPSLGVIAWNNERRLHQTFAFNDTCVFHCPLNYTHNLNTNTCVPCSNSNNCEQHCPGGDIGSLQDAKRFEGCNYVDGSLTISLLTDSNIDGSLTRYLGQITHVDGYVEIVNSPRLKTLEFLHNLTSINANDLLQYGGYLYGLVIINNRILQSVRWEGQEKLLVGGLAGANVLVVANYFLCEDSISKLESQLPMIQLHEYYNSYFAVCHVAYLNLSFQTDENGTAYLQWDPVPHNNQTNLTRYQILWQVVSSSSELPEEEYDENNPEGCGSIGWKSVTVGNVTSRRPRKDMLQPWSITVFQVVAKFAQHGTTFKSSLLYVSGSKTVPSCPIIIVKSLVITSFSVNLSWRFPRFYNDDVMSYLLAVTRQDKMENETSLDSFATTTLPCDIDTADAQSQPSCITAVQNVTATIEYCSPNTQRCRTTINGLDNYFDYQVKIQAVNPAGCGLVSAEAHFRTRPDYDSDVVTNMSVTGFLGPDSSSEVVQVSWKRPERPNGGKVQHYVVEITFRLSEEEVINSRQTHEMRVLPRLEELDCSQTKDHNHYLYSCEIPSMEEAWISQNFTLLRIFGRQLSYNITVKVVSGVEIPGTGTPNDPIPKVLKQFTVHVDTSIPQIETKGKGSKQAALIIALPVVALFLASIIIVLVYCMWKMKHKQKRLQSESMHRLYISMDGVTEYMPDEWEMKRDDVILGEELGHGAFGLVYEGTWQNPEGRPLHVAVKTLNNEATKEDRLAFLFEASVMKHFDSDYIVRLLGIVSNGTPVMVVMELMQKGDLKGYLRSLRPEGEEVLTFQQFPLPEEELLQMAMQIASGMVYLTTKKFVHRDLAARNCMVTENAQIKIGDFGMTRDVYQSDYYRKKGHGVLPVRWMPPESLQDGVFSHSSDVWSFGIVLWEVATLAMQPYPGMSNSDVLEYVIRGGVMDIGGMKHIPSMFSLIMERCWIYNPTDRPSFETILACLLPFEDVGTTV